jgi:hypothetical protein
MIMVAQFLVATTLIVGLIALRVYADRCALRDTLRKNQTEHKEECMSCTLKTTRQNRASLRPF